VPIGKEIHVSSNVCPYKTNLFPANMAARRNASCGAGMAARRNWNCHVSCEKRSREFLQKSSKIAASPLGFPKLLELKQILQG
jgi:hypothetical protein